MGLVEIKVGNFLEKEQLFWKFFEELVGRATIVPQNVIVRGGTRWHKMVRKRHLGMVLFGMALKVTGARSKRRK